jgi:hypothetical protein
MGEAKRRRNTLDGGPPSEERVALDVEVFEPLAELAAARDPLFLEAIAFAIERAHKRPTPIGAGCDYEFRFGEAPALLFCTRPFIPEGERFQSISGQICPRCAALAPEAMWHELFARLKAVRPDLHLQELSTGGHA